MIPTLVALVFVFLLVVAMWRDDDGPGVP